MPLYKDRIAQQLEKKIPEFSGTTTEAAVQEYSNTVQTLPETIDHDEITNALEDREYPGAIPTSEFNDFDEFVSPFEESRDWKAHESVNTWARNQLEGKTTIAADGSQIDPITEFEQPVGLVQVVWMANHHAEAGEYEEDAETVVLTPEDLLFEDPNSGYVHVDDQEVPLTRFETEMQVLEKQIQQYSNIEPPPVVMYDGSLILSFIQTFDQETKERYATALSRLLAASRYHQVPVVGYVSGSKATELATMLQELDLIDTHTKVRDHQFLEELMHEWGSRTPLMYAHRDKTQNRLQTMYRGSEFDFSDAILFTYMNIGPGTQIDRIECPAWIHTEEMTDYVLSVIRAEAGVGRGYPEILQSVDADAVISHEDREEFLRMYQEFSDEHNIDLQWNNKALSKKRRRR
ncbi:MAG: DNA double-strand break repair nuclease NurA [Halobacteriaceae archaeon]